MIKVYYPAFLNIREKKVVVVGGGRVAYRKVKALLEAGARCHVVSPELDQRLKEIAAKGWVDYVQDVFRQNYLDGAWLVVAATNDPKVQEAVYQYCEKRHIFCNVVDVPSRCSFIVPAVLKRGALRIAVSTMGLAPGLSRRIRQELEGLFPTGYGRYVNAVGKLRKYIIRHFSNSKERKEALARLFDLGISMYFMNGDMERIEKWAREIGGEDAVKIVRGDNG